MGWINNQKASFLKLGVAFTFMLSLAGCDVVQQVAYETASVVLAGESGGNTTPTGTEVAGGLKEALLKSTLNSVTSLSAENGFFNNDLVKVPFPEELKQVKQTLTNVGLESVVTSFEKELNKGAEKAVVKARPIFESAIKQMTFQDAMSILLGDDKAATAYFEKTTRQQLYNLFAPEVKTVLDNFGIANGYKDLMSNYNAIPFVKPVNTDLTDYVTQKTLDGLFVEVALQEKSIRSDISLRSTDLLQKVFGYADIQKQ